MFIGYPRSGHSLVGSIIDAHPNACISHELDALAVYKQYAHTSDFFRKIQDLSAIQAKNGRISYGYSYRFDTLSSGKTEHLQVIGDKKGSGTTQQLIKDIHALDTFSDFVQLPLKIIHVTRNPFDIITTKAGYKDLKTVPVTANSIAESSAVIYAEAKMNQQLIDAGLNNIHSFSHECLVENPEATLQKLFDFLDLEINTSFIQQISKNLFGQVNQSRKKYAWSAAEIQQVNDSIIQLPIFSNYSYE